MPENTAYRSKCTAFRIAIHPFDELKRVAHYPMHNLSEKTRQSCHLSIINNDQLLIVAQMRSPNAVSLSIEEGTHFPLSLTTSGRVFLSMFDEDKRIDILSRDVHYKKWSQKQKDEFLSSRRTSKNRRLPFCQK